MSENNAVLYSAAVTAAELCADLKAREIIERREDQIRRERTNALQAQMLIEERKQKEKALREKEDALHQKEEERRQKEEERRQKEEERRQKEEERKKRIEAEKELAVLRKQLAELQVEKP